MYSSFSITSKEQGKEQRSRGEKNLRRIYTFLFQELSLAIFATDIIIRLPRKMQIKDIAPRLPES